MLSVGVQSRKGLAPVVPVRTPIGGFCFFSRRLDPRLVGEATLVCLENDGLAEVGRRWSDSGLHSGRR